MSPARRMGLPLAAVVLLAGCSAEPVRVQVRAFEHPEDVAFVCFDVLNGEALPLGACAGSADDSTVALHALVTQSGRGQVAVVDLDDDEVLDADQQVPGFTFVPVGEIPSDIVVPPNDPELTFVSDLGSLDVLGIETRRLRFGPRDGESGQPFVRIPMPAAPAALALSPDESKLYVSLPTLGALAVIERSEVAIGAEPPTPTLISLDTTVPAPMSAAPPDADYCRVCRAADGEDVENPVGCEGLLLDPWPTDADGMRVPTTPREPVPVGTDAQPRPGSMVVDELHGRLLVADGELPIVHVIDLDTGAPMAPIVTSVPTVALALTPRVPTSIDGVVDPADPTTYERYLYAIDATDRSVMVLRYDETDPSLSAVLPVNARGSVDADRIRLPSGARVIQVVTPDYPDAPGEPDPVRCTRGTDLEDNAGPLELRGVFLMVGLLDGTVRAIDVYDLDAECRGGGPDGDSAGCTNPPDPDDSTVYIRRHRPRIGSRITSDLTLVTAPTFTTDRATATAESDGSTGDPTIPDLEPLTEVGCGPFELPVFPFEGDDPLVCVLSDPWAAEVEVWLATWEGAIPGTSGGRGRFADPSTGEFLVEVPVCDRGVLGRDNLAATDPGAYESRYQPDLLAITGTLPPSTADREECQRFVDPEDPDGGLVDIEIPILRAEQREMDGDLQHVLTLADGPRTLDASLAELADCFPELVTYEIRSQGAYTVLGGRTGYLHRVRVDEATGLCAVDTSVSGARVGKALPETLFDNGLVRFRLSDPEPPLGPGSDVEMSFQIAQVPGELSIPIAQDLSTVLSDIAYSEMDQRLYVVDTQFSGLVRIQLDPVSVLQTFE